MKLKTLTRLNEVCVMSFDFHSTNGLLATDDTIFYVSLILIYHQYFLLLNIVHVKYLLIIIEKQCEISFIFDIFTFLINLKNT